MQTIKFQFLLVLTLPCSLYAMEMSFEKKATKAKASKLSVIESVHQNLLSGFEEDSERLEKDEVEVVQSASHTIAELAKTHEKSDNIVAGFAQMPQDEVVKIVREAQPELVDSFCKKGNIVDLFYVGLQQPSLFDRQDVRERIISTESNYVRDFLLDERNAELVPTYVNALDHEKFHEVINGCESLHINPAVQARLLHEGPEALRQFASHPANTDYLSTHLECPALRSALLEFCDEATKKQVSEMYGETRLADLAPLLEIDGELENLALPGELVIKLAEKQLEAELAEQEAQEQPERTLSAADSKEASKEVTVAANKPKPSTDPKQKPADKQNASHQLSPEVQATLQKCGHGFAALTPISTVNGYESIAQIHENPADHDEQYVKSYDPITKSSSLHRIKKSLLGEANCYLELSFGKKTWAIACTPNQEFYVQGKWVPACELKVGDGLLSEGNQIKQIAEIRFINKPFKFHAMEVEDSHTFFVGADKILTHNMMAAYVSLGYEIGKGAVTGGVLGLATLCPFTITAGIVVGGAAGLIMYWNNTRKDKISCKATFNAAAIELLQRDRTNDNVIAMMPGGPEGPHEDSELHHSVHCDDDEEKNK